MNSTLRNLALSATLIAVPAAGFALAEMMISPAVHGTAAARSPGLGDLSAYTSIVNDTQTIAATGDFAAAEHRITDLETLWDQNASALRQVDRAAWNTVDAAADETFSALRAGLPDQATVDAALSALSTALDAPVPAAATGPVQYVSGIAVTDESGRAIPCEDLIGQLRTAIGSTTPVAAVADLQAKALERCNADDDAHADAFSAQALALLNG
ncbi:hypothetical protein VK792_12385 [Mesobacterium sp. TK19101]|uniref:Secreted protein n=1 Tax=Mesobacterium hydrothermale TaxID=3111907 RepID=A0ABU6HI06_9RHOB|nr:hypothetical protein [Mesobacterium sp. TK19101]MEC3862083.1 hypothetical protein [Mesobacterium sp. TK19101]